LANDHRPAAYELRLQGHSGESRNKHFTDAADMSLMDNGVHNGMNEEPDTPRFGADAYDG
jgi:hypothetical protein